MRTALSKGSRTQRRVFLAGRFPVGIHVRTLGKLDLIAGGARRQQHGRGIRASNDRGRGFRRRIDKVNLIAPGPRRKQRFRGKGGDCDCGKHRTQEETFIFHTYFFFIKATLHCIAQYLSICTTRARELAGVPFAINPLGGKVIG